MRKVGILTAGGDSPGINALIRAIYFFLKKENIELYGILKGWKGFFTEEIKKIEHYEVEDISSKGGTILKTSRFNPLKQLNFQKIISTKIEQNRFDCIIVCGDFDTLRVANELSNSGIPLICVPQTIDNDINGTDFSLGFFSAIKNIIHSLDIIRSTNQSHERDILVEIMGKEAGWLTVFAAISKKVEGFFIPEIPASINDIAELLNRRKKMGKRDNIILIAEGVNLKEIERKFDFSEIYKIPELSGITLKIAEILKNKLEEKPKTVILSYIQRGGNAAVYDILLGTRFAEKIVEQIKKKEYNFVVGVKEDKVYTYKINEAIEKFRLVPTHYIDLARKMVNNY